MFTRRSFIESSALAAGGLLLSDVEAEAATGTKLEIEFIGLCAFVDAQPGSGKRVGLMNATYFQNLHPVLPAHVGWLAVETSGLVNEDGGEPVSSEELNRWRLGTQGQFRKWRLHLRRVEMTVSRPDRLSGGCSKAVRLSEALKRSDPKHQDPKLKTNWWALEDAAERVVTGVVILGDGDLKNGKARKDNYKHKFDEADWTFQPFLHDPPVKQKLLDAYTCTTRNVTSIRLTGTSTETLRLKDNARARAFVVNLPECRQEPAPEESAHSARILHHVRAYYALFEGFKPETTLLELLKTPVPIATNLEPRSPSTMLERATECVRIEGDIYCPGGTP